MIMSRYILKEHISPFIFGLSLIIFIFTMNLLFQMLGRITGKGIPLMIILEYFALNLAWIVALAVPMAVLIATVSAFGRLSSDGEITALRASGIAPTRLIRPVLGAAAFLAVGIGLFNNYLLPDMNHRNKLLLADISRKRPIWKLDPGVFDFSIPNYVLRSDRIDSENNLMHELVIFDSHKPDQRSTIVADSGKLSVVETEERIMLMLFDGEIHRPSPDEPDLYEKTSFDSAVFRIDAPGMVLKRARSGHRGDRELSAEQMWGMVQEMKRDSRGTRYEMRRIASYMVEIHKKFSIPVACLVFVLLGTPLGVMAHRGGLGVSGAISLIFFTIYWALLINGEDLANRLLVSPVVAMWSPNVILTLFGLWMMWLAKGRTSLPLVGWVSATFGRIFGRRSNRSGNSWHDSGVSV